MNVSRDELLTQLRALDSYAFEKLIADIWEYRGWDTTVTSPSRDGGIDVIARKDLPFAQKQFIQAKRYARSNKVGVEDVQQYSSLYLDKSPDRDVDADVVALVTTSSLTAPARKKAAEHNLRIVDGETLTEMILEWDLSEIVSEYVDSDAESESAFHDDIDTSVEAYEGSRNWTMVEEFNEMAMASSEDMKLTATADGSVAYTVFHGRSHQNNLEERRNIHHLADLDTEQLDRLKYLANDLGMRFLSGDGPDEWKIYDKGEGAIDPHRTVEIGMRILNGIFGSAFGDANIDVAVGNR
ncbi:restriction endonuclease [Halorubrum sp. SD690R]|uniref:restriction endonuclease n=1 Tax=Halorubrum sp. SD690R TaxID=2518117 RepID=UPI0010F55A01|nr:restriction endonuclease [Halorubrum sp. SD690R]TKX45582.1 restriction endonuclease [Halorubrum sp. SD690R]